MCSSDLAPPMRSTTILLMLLALCMAGCSDVSEPRNPEYKTGLPSDELRASVFKSEFPLEYETYVRNNESEIMTEYCGSVNYNENDNAFCLSRRPQLFR